MTGGIGWACESIAPVMLWLRAVAVWLILIGAEVVHGALRTLYLAPRVGDLRARQLGVFIGSGLILAIACLAAPWLRAETSRSQLIVGSGWLALTLLFEVGFGRVVLGYSWARVASDYNIFRGGLLPIGLLVLLLAPWITARLTAMRRRA